MSDHEHHPGCAFGAPDCPAFAEPETLYPKSSSKADFIIPSVVECPWMLDCYLAYDGGGGRWQGYYRTRLGARLAAWWHYHFASWGGSITLIDRRKEVNEWLR